MLRRPALLDAALARIAEFAQARTGVFVVCPMPIVFSSILARRGLHGGITVVEGEQRHAIQLARGIGSAKVVMYTDSEPAARSMSHLEILELAERHAVPVSGDAALAASIHGVSYETRRVTDHSATVVRSDGFEDRSSPITSIVVASGYALVTLRAKPQRAPPWGVLRMSALEKIAAADISIEMLQWFGPGMRFLVPTRRLASLQIFAREFDLGYHATENCARLSVVGMGVRSTAGVFYRGVSSLTARNIPVLHCADSNVTLSFVVSDRLSHDAGVALREALAPGRNISGGSPLSFDADLGRVRLSGSDIRLGARQAQLLRHLLDNVGRVIEAQELARVLFDSEDKEHIAAVRVHLHNLRKKIEHDPESPRYIVTVPEQGYVFVR